MIYLGVSACFMYPDKNRTFFGPKTLAYLENDMAKYLAQDGVMPVLLPDLEKKDLFKLVDQMDGLVFQGGSDLSPKSYKEPFLNESRWPGDYYRDQYELSLFDYAFQKKMPILAICRGAQLMNVYFGGTLYQDLKTELPHIEEHRNAELYDKISHPVRFARESFLEKIYAKDSSPRVVNSVHHQGFKKLGDDLSVEARSSGDALVEAIKYNNSEHYVLGVQWHPEFSHTLKGEVLNPAPLLDSFLEECKKH